jgi:hypothetical protein
MVLRAVAKKITVQCTGPSTIASGGRLLCPRDSGADQLAEDASGRRFGGSSDLKRAIRRSLGTSGRRHPVRRLCWGTSQSPRRISICARCRAPRNGVATRSSRAPILARAGAHGAAQAPFAGYLALGSKRLRRLAGRRP